MGQKTFTNKGRSFITTSVFLAGLSCLSSSPAHFVSLTTLQAQEKTQAVKAATSAKLDHTQESDHDNVTRFLLEMIEISSLEQSTSDTERKQIPQKFRETLAKHPDLLIKILNTRSLAQFFEEAKIPFSTTQIEKNLATDYPLIKELENLRNQKDFSNKIESDVSILKTKFDNMTMEQRLQYLSYIPDQHLQGLAKNINHEIEQLKFSETPAVKMLNDPEKGFSFKNAPAKFVEFFNILMKQYLDKFSLEDKREIVMAILRLPPGASDVQMLSAVLQHSGPVVQKFFQLLGKNVKSPTLLALMEELKNNIAPFSSEQAIKIIESNYGKKVDDIFSSFQEKPIAAASIGQVHLAKLKGSDTEVIVKLLRPGIAAKAAREIKIMEELAPNEGIREIINRLKENIEEEMDFRLEAANLKKGQVYRRKELGIYAVKEIQDYPAHKDVFLMEKAVGKNFNKYQGKTESKKDKIKELVKKQDAIARLTEVWLKEAFTKSGFFHADLHAGNLFFQPRNNGNGSLLTLIDFGSVGQLTLAEKKGIITLSLGIIFLSPEIVLDSLMMFDNIAPVTQKELLALFAKVTSNRDLSISSKTNEIMNIALEKGIKFPKNFVQFNRGKAFLDGHLQDIQRELDVLDPKGKIKRVSSKNLLARVMVKGLTPDLAKYFIHIGRGRGLVDKKTIKRIVDHHLKDFLKKNLKKIIFKNDKNKSRQLPTCHAVESQMNDEKISGPEFPSEQKESEKKQQEKMQQIVLQPAAAL